MGSQCDECMYFEYDEEYDEYSCVMDLDQDEMYHFLTGKTASCPYFKAGDEYSIVRKQI